MRNMCRWPLWTITALRTVELVRPTFPTSTRAASTSPAGLSDAYAFEQPVARAISASGMVANPGKMSRRKISPS